jgi:dipeptidyl aminopeptidase/acylaminoacyl peptidase
MILLLIASLAVAASPLTMTDYVSMPAISAVHFSPEGSRIAYVITRPNFAHASYDGEIHVINTDGTGDVTLTRSDASDDHPRWSPDGKRIAFLSDRGGRTAVFTIDVDGGEASALTDEPTAIRDFDWSPDGRMIVFTRGDDATADEKRRTKEKDDAHVIGENPRYSRLYAIDVDNVADDDSIGWCVHYRLRDRAALESYLREYAPQMRAEGIARFGTQFRAERRILHMLSDD